MKRGFSVSQNTISGKLSFPQKSKPDSQNRDLSPFRQIAMRLVENGFHPLPVIPEKKIPGVFKRGVWYPMTGWADFCDKEPSFQLISEWEKWPETGVSVAHGEVVALDVDTDQPDILKTIAQVFPNSEVKRRGAKGYMAYYRRGKDLENSPARSCWYRNRTLICEFLRRGTQSVLPPSLHPDTGQPYFWITRYGLHEIPLADLAEIVPEHLIRLDEALGKMGITATSFSRKNAAEPPRASLFSKRDTLSDPESLRKAVWRQINDMALEPEMIDFWWPALLMPKSRQRGRGAWEAVPFWRSSSKRRPLAQRKPNLRAAQNGIVDFGTGQTYTPIDLVMTVRKCCCREAKNWLLSFQRSDACSLQTSRGSQSPCPAAPEGTFPHIQARRSQPIFLGEAANDPSPKPAAEKEREGIQGIEACPQEERNAPKTSREQDWLFEPCFPSKKAKKQKTDPIMPSEAEFRKLMPENRPFPLTDVEENCPGLLGQLASYLDHASAMETESGGLGIALPVLGAVMGRVFETWTGLRTNIYSVVLGRSGTGKSSLVNPAKDVLQRAELGNLIGQDRIASGSGLNKMLSLQPKRICFLDEFGHMLQQVGMPGAGIHAKQIISELTQLFSAARSVHTGIAYATRPVEQIQYPHLCLFGMATPEQFWRAFSSSSMEDGSIARYLVFPLGHASPRDPSTEKQGQIVAALQELKRVTEQREGRKLGGIPDTRRVSVAEKAEKARLALVRTMDGCARYAECYDIRGAGAILRRVAENALKIALISAIGRNPDSPQINEQDFDIGHALARWSGGLMITSIASHIADNQFERDVNDVERFIAAAGSEGRLWRQLQRRFRRIRKRDLQDIVEGLEKEGSIGIQTDACQRGGHPIRTFIIREQSKPAGGSC